MHDVDEGCLDGTLSCVLKDLIIKKRLSVADLNDRVQGFPYGFSEIKNRPPVITEDQSKSGNLRMTASERVCLARYLGLMIGDYVEVDGEDVEIWKLYVTVRDICQFYSRPTVSEVGVPFIRNLQSARASQAFSGVILTRNNIETKASLHAASC